ncbi:MAG: VCBS repeat-containing protein, partial [Sphingobacteriales bacterium]
DGDNDLLASVNNKLTVYENTDGAGTFATMQLFTLGLNYLNIPATPVDLDLDGDLDILCYYSTGNAPYQGQIVWFRNDGSGNFGEEELIISDNALIATSLINVADVDGDGFTDILLGHQDYNKISWLKHLDGNGTFGPVATVTTAAGLVKSVSGLDVDSDGKLDIVASLSGDNKVVWYRNTNGQGSFASETVIASDATASNAVIAEDIDGDNIKDIVYTGLNDIKWMHREASGVFGPAQTITNTAYKARFVVYSDIDGDGVRDLVSASQDDHKVAWYKHVDASGTFGRQVVISRKVYAPNYSYPADLDSDGDVDVLANSQHDAKLAWYENVDGNAFYGKQHIITEDTGVGNTTPIAYPVDIDGDGDIDIASAHEGVLFWYENDGLGNFGTTHTIDSTQSASIIRGADIDGDGDFDLVFGVYNEDKIMWFENLDGQGSFGPEHVVMPANGNNGGLTSLEVADMDNDGDIDIIASTFDWTVYYFKNADGAGTFEEPANFEFDGMAAISPADIDGDGDMDIAGVSALGGGAFEAVVWYENTNGLGDFSIQHNISDLTVHGKAIIAVDIDNDGDIDVVTAAGHSNTSGQLAWYENTGQGNFGPRQMIHERFDSSIGMDVTAADTDGDNDLDLIAIFGTWASSTLGKISVFENLGQLGNTINGVVTIDSDSNGCSANDLKGSNMMIVTQNGANTFATFTDANGAYSIAANDGAFTAAISSALPQYYVSNPGSHTFTFSGLDDVQSADFCVAPSGVVNDLSISVYPLTDLRPGFGCAYRIVCRNTGTTQIGGVVNYTFNGEKMSFVSASPSASAQTQDMLSFTIAPLQPFASTMIDLDFTTLPLPATEIGELVATSATLVADAQDATPDNNVASVSQTVIGSYDPNDITCLEGTQVHIDDSGDYLHYVIRFQNTGTASAVNVRVENPLSNNLDWTSMQLETMSHPGRVEIIDGVNLRFIFENINLPHSEANEPLS